MQTELQNYLSQSYNLAAIQSIAPVTAGFLSENYILDTAQGRYFLKQYRYTDWQDVAAVHGAKFFFAKEKVTAQTPPPSLAQRAPETGEERSRRQQFPPCLGRVRVGSEQLQEKIPVILPLANKQGETFFAYADRYYCLFPFVTGRHLARGSFSQRAIESSAKMLARIHLAGRHASVPYVRKVKLKRSYEQFVETAQQILHKIPQTGRTAFDELTERCLHLKLHLAKRHQADFAAIDLAVDHLIHGDYQDGNLFFDDQEQISHVFDWEKTEIAPRGLELVRAIEFICLSNPGDYKAVFSEANFAKARHFLQSYHQLYPIPQQELFAAVQTRYLHKILSLWVESEHYLQQNQRVDLFLESEYHAVDYYASFLNEYVEQISGSY